MRRNYFDDLLPSGEVFKRLAAFGWVETPGGKPIRLNKLIKRYLDLDGRISFTHTRKYAWSLTLLPAFGIFIFTKTGKTIRSFRFYTNIFRMPTAKDRDLKRILWSLFGNTYVRNIRLPKSKNEVESDSENSAAALGAWIMYQMKHRRLTQNDIAIRCDVSSEFVHMVIWGKRMSARIQKQIATSLGYSSWMELLSTHKEVAV